MLRTCRTSRLVDFRSVCPESVLWQNGPLDPDAVWGGEWDQSRIGVLDGVVHDRRREGAVLGVNLRHPIVTNGPLLHSCVSATRSSQITLRTCLHTTVYSMNISTIKYTNPVFQTTLGRVGPTVSAAT